MTKVKIQLIKAKSTEVFAAKGISVVRKISCHCVECFKFQVRYRSCSDVCRFIWRHIIMMGMRG